MGKKEIDTATQDTNELCYIDIAKSMKSMNPDVSPSERMFMQNFVKIFEMFKSFRLDIHTESVIP